MWLLGDNYNIIWLFDGFSKLSSITMPVPNQQLSQHKKTHSLQFTIYWHDCMSNLKLLLGKFCFKYYTWGTLSDLGDCHRKSFRMKISRMFDDIHENVTLHNTCYFLLFFSFFGWNSTWHPSCSWALSKTTAQNLQTVEAHGLALMRRAKCICEWNTAYYHNTNPCSSFKSSSSFLILSNWLSSSWRPAARCSFSREISTSF